MLTLPATFQWWAAVRIKDYGLKEWCCTDKYAKNMDQVKKGGQGRDEILQLMVVFVAKGNDRFMDAEPNTVALYLKKKKP